VAKRFQPDSEAAAPPVPSSLSPPVPSSPASPAVRWITIRVPLAERPAGMHPSTYFQLDLPAASRAAAVMGKILAGLEATGARVVKYGTAEFAVERPAEALRWIIEELAAAEKKGQEETGKGKDGNG